MISTLFFIGSACLFIAWCVGMVRAWNGQAALALRSAGAWTVLSIGTMLIAIFGDRYSELLFGSLGHGDGMGMIGLITMAAAGVVVSLIAMVIAWATLLARRGRISSNEKEV